MSSECFAIQVGFASRCSADTWVPQQGFQCFNLTGSPVPPATCNFGTTGFNVNASKTFEPFPNVSFNITYGSSEFVAGPVGFDTVSVGGLEVSRQVVPLPNVAAWLGDGILSGIIVRFSNKYQLVLSAHGVVLGPRFS